MSNEVTISLPSGKTVIGHAPVIVSASRSTDIPAFYADWFMNRLRSGYCVWYNPFNQKPMYISFAKTKVVVFWTKNPEPMLKYLPELDRLGLHYYFQVTLNDYVDEGFEPNVGPVSHRVEVFKRLSDAIGTVLNVPCQVSADARDCVVLGCAKVLTDPAGMRHLLSMN